MRVPRIARVLVGKRGRHNELNRRYYGWSCLTARPRQGATGKSESSMSADK